jgi:hypothetical protein
MEQRQQARYDVEIAAEVYTQNSVLAANTRNLSASGVCLDIPEGLAEGSTVGVSLFFTSDGIEDPDAEPLNVKASVVWCTEREDEGFSAGARFEEMTKEHTDLLKAYLSALGE